MTLEIDPSQPNFRRSVQVTSDKDDYVGSGEIDRVHMVRSGQKIDSDDYDVNFSAVGHKTIKVTIDNGDEKLDAPVYDYAKLFLLAKDAAPAQLGGEQANAAYTGRPDERPWTEKHPAVLWIAIVAAVLILGAIALRSMKTAVAT